MLYKANALTQCGFECHMYIEEGELVDLSARIEDYYGKFDSTYIHGTNLKQPYDLIISTVFYSSFLARNSGQTCPIVYLNQDYEAQFHPMGDGHLVGEMSYLNVDAVVTIGRWLTHLATEEFGLRSYPVEIAADIDTYAPIPGVRRENAICFVYQPEKFRRCPDLGIRALEIVKRRRPDVQIYTFGSPANLKIDFDCNHLGMLPGPHDINEVYNRCRVGFEFEFDESFACAVRDDGRSAARRRSLSLQQSPGYSRGGLAACVSDKRERRRSRSSD